MLLIGQLNVLLLLLVLQCSCLLAVLPVDQDVTDLLGQIEVNRVVLDESLDRVSAVIDLTQLDEERNQIIELTVLRIIIPALRSVRRFSPGTDGMPESKSSPERTA